MKEWFKALQSKCSYCGKYVKLRMASNSPAYCCYECAVNGQPDKAKAIIKNQAGLNG